MEDGGREIRKGFLEVVFGRQVEFGEDTGRLVVFQVGK